MDLAGIATGRVTPDFTRPTAPPNIKLEHKNAKKRKEPDEQEPIDTQNESIAHQFKKMVLTTN